MWTIIDMKYRVSDGIATEVTAEYRLTNGNQVARNIIYIDLPEPTGDIIPLNELTEEQVIVWIKSIYPYEDVEATIQAELARLVEIENNKTEESGLPWI